MNKRTRKKQLKKHNAYINPRELWNLDVTLTNFILPRLKAFRKADKMGFPAGVANEEKWNEILDKMILAFECMNNDNWWYGNPKYDIMLYTKSEQFISEDGHLGTRFIHLDGYDEAYKNWMAEANRRDKCIRSGLQLFATYYQNLWD